MKKRKGFYSISVVAKMFSVHQQTIRMYEKEGLITPKRTDGNTRLFSEEDVDRLEEIINLTHKMGVNLAGVEIILKLQKKLSKMQQEINKVFQQTETEMVQEAETLKDAMKAQVTRLADIKRQNKAPDGQTAIGTSKGPKSGGLALTRSNEKPQRGGKKKAEDDEPVDDWSVDYED